MSNPSPTDELLARYLADELSAEDRARVDAWAAADASHGVELERLREELERHRTQWQARTASAGWNVERAWSRVDAQLESGATVTPIRSAPVWYRQTIWQAAAALLLVAGGGYYWRARSPAPVLSEQRFATAVGEPRELVLADSTLVTLGPSSTLRVLAGYGGNERVIELVGEASFRVRHDAARPFSVRAAGTVTLDLGTEFAVRAVEGDTLVRVTVFEGAASLRRESDPVNRAVTLRAHDVGVLSANSTTVRTEQDSSAQLAWRDGQLAFEASTLSDVAAELRRWYPVTVALPDSVLGARRVSATLPARDLAEALEILRLALRVEIVQRGDTVYFR